MSSAGGEKRASTGEGGGEKKKKKKNYKWLLEGVWSEHELDGKTYYYNHINKSSVWEHPFEKVTKVEVAPVKSEASPPTATAASSPETTAAVAVASAIKIEHASIAAVKVEEAVGEPKRDTDPVPMAAPAPAAAEPEPEPKPEPIDLSQLPAPEPEDLRNLLRAWVDVIAPGKADALLNAACKEVLSSSYTTAKGEEVLSGMATEPEWLKELMGDNSWRKLLVGLATAHPKDLFLNAFVVPSLASKGYHMDVIDVQNSLTQYFVFQMFLSDIVIDASTKGCHVLEAGMGHTVSVLSRNEFTTILTLAMLETLDIGNELPVAAAGAGAEASTGEQQRSPLDVFRSLLRTGVLTRASGIARWNLSRLRQEVERDLSHSEGKPLDQATLRLVMLTSHAIKSIGASDAPLPLRNALLGAFFSEAPVSSAAQSSGQFPYLTIPFKKHIHDLATAYSGALDVATFSSAPPTRYLRRFQLINNMVAKLFDHTVTIEDGFKNNLALLVAVAACIPDGPPNAVAVQSAVDLRAVLLSVYEEIREETHLKSFLNAAPMSTNMEQQALIWPSVAYGVLSWALLDSELSPERVLILVEQLTDVHPMLRGVGLSIVRKQFVSSSDVLLTSLREFRQSCTRLCVKWILCGYVFPVIGFMQDMHVTLGEGLDEGVTKEFLNTLLSHVSAPYSPDFHAAVKAFIALPTVSAIIPRAEGSLRARVARFLDPPLEE